MENINHRNYKRGLIKGYELAFQDKNWYDKNKNNFCDSIKNKYPNLIPSYVKNSKVKNYLGFLPDDLIRFGELELIEMKIENNKIQFWVVKIPKDFSLYHSSRALGLNHSNFPLIGYDNNKNPEENFINSNKLCPVDDFIGKIFGNIYNSKVCTYVTYYSTPYLTKSYLRKNTGYGENAIKYAYGVDPTSPSKDTTYNDRLNVKAKIKKNSVIVTPEYEGVSAYLTKEDTYLFILGLDDILINRPDLGKQNMNNFHGIIKLLENYILSEYNIDKKNYDRFLNLILSVGGIGSIQDNIDILKRDYSVDVEKGFKKWLEINAKHYSENPLFTAGIISKFSEFKNLKEIPGIRFSTFEHDRPVMNMLSWLFRRFPTYLGNKQINVAGFISSSLYVYSKGKGDITKGEIFTIKDLPFYSSRGYFHSELGLFYAPEDLERNRNNKYDNEYMFNYMGLVQEYRKFKTTNLMSGNTNQKGFHQGHLLEHNSWVGIVASTLSEKEEYRKYGSDKIANKNIYLLAGFLHDIGKSGECTEKAVYHNLNHQDARMSVCKYIKDENEEIIGMKYHSLPAHPSEGYEYLKGYKTYKKFTLEGRQDVDSYNASAQKVYLEDWNKFFDHINLNEFERRMIRITVGAHWEFGDYLKKLSNGQEIDKLAEKYLRSIEIFYNNEFNKLDKENFKRILIFVVILSIADIFGSEYDPRRILTEDEMTTIINYLPNISLNDINRSNDSSKVVREIIVKSLNNAYQDSNKRRVFQNLRENWEKFLKYCLKKIDNFDFSPNNNYSLLYNLKNSYVAIEDLKVAYPNYFPKIIVFDLDQTLFSIRFFNDKITEYHIYEDTYKIIQEIQKLREGDNKTFVALASRHYAPLALKNLLKSKIYEGKENPLYYENFDFIVSRYTGPRSKIENTVSKYSNFFFLNGNPNDGFIMDKNGEYYNITDKSNFLKLTEISKDGHYDLIRRRYDVNYSDILAFDDDTNYFEGGEGLSGPAKDIFVAGVLNSTDSTDAQGIRYSLFREGVAFYMFNKLKKM